VLDASHASDDVVDQMVELSVTPIVLSHSGAKAVLNHPRNIDDERIKRLAAKVGVIQINSYSDDLIPTPPAPGRDAAMRALRMKYGSPEALPPDRHQAYVAERHAIEAKYPLLEGTIDDFTAQLLHALKLAGPDHVGIGLDMDGGGGVKGLEDVGDDTEITRRLLAAGYTEEDLGKICNVLRVMRAVEARAHETHP
jgi:membrane dipeptidase